MLPSELTLSESNLAITLRVLLEPGLFPDVSRLLKGRNSICFVLHCVLMRLLFSCILSCCNNCIITHTNGLFFIPPCEESELGPRSFERGRPNQMTSAVVTTGMTGNTYKALFRKTDFCA